MGLFGRKKKSAMDMWSYSGPPVIDESGAVLPVDNTMYRVPDMQQKQSWMDGGKFTGKDALGMVLGAIGDGLSGQKMIAPMVMQGFADKRKEQQRQSMMAQIMPALKAQGYTDQQAQLIMAGMGDTIPKGPEPTAMERNVAAWQNMTPQQREAYQQMQEAQSGPVTLTLPGNRVYSGPRSGLAEAMGGTPSGVPTAPVGKLTPIGPTTQNTPAPQTGANGFPSVLTPDQYQATVNAMGKQATDDWMRRHNIRIGGR